MRVRKAQRVGENKSLLPNFVAQLTPDGGYGACSVTISDCANARARTSTRDPNEPLPSVDTHHLSLFASNPHFRAVGVLCPFAG